MYFVRCRAVMESGQVLMTHTEVHEDAWREAREAVVRSLAGSVQWYVEQADETLIGDIEFIVMGEGFLMEEIERGVL